MVVERLCRKSVDLVVASADRGPFGDVAHFCPGRLYTILRVDSPQPPRAAARDDGVNTNMSHHPLHQTFLVIRTLLNRCDNVVTKE